MNYEELFEKAEVAGEEGAFTRIDEEHPVGLFLGIEHGQRAVMIICTRPPPDPPSLAAIQVESHLRSRGEWALVLRLARPELKAPFTRLVEDLDSATRHRPGDPGEVVVGRLARWQRLLSRGGGNGLEDNELRGLGAELDFLLGEAIPSFGPDQSVAAWDGPFDAPKDFAFDFTEVEVKALHDNQRAISISSLEQLTDAGRPLHLWCRVVELGVSVQGGPDSFSRLVGRVRESIAGTAAAAEAFEERLRSAGYEDLPAYETRSVRFGPAFCYRVEGDFPRLQRGGTPTSIVRCVYSIATSDLAPFRVATWRIGPSHEG